MSTATLAARLLRRGAASSSSLRALTRRALHCTGAAPLTRRLPAAASHWTAAHRFLASQSPASSKASSADENLRRVLDSEIECVVQSEESTADKVSLLFLDIRYSLPRILFVSSPFYFGFALVLGIMIYENLKNHFISMLLLFEAGRNFLLI
jgi:hypothetical protein